MKVKIKKLITMEFSLHTAMVFSQLSKTSFVKRSYLVEKLNGFVAPRTVYQSLTDLERFGYVISKNEATSKNGKRFCVFYKIAKRGLCCD